MPVFIALFMWLTVAHAEGDGNTLVTLTGESSAVKVGESFTVEIKAKDVSDLYGIEFQLAYFLCRRIMSSSEAGTNGSASPALTITR
jgi:hypothetical protein